MRRRGAVPPVEELKRAPLPHPRLCGDVAEYGGRSSPLTSRRLRLLRRTGWLLAPLLITSACGQAASRSTDSTGRTGGNAGSGVTNVASAPAPTPKVPVGACAPGARTLCIMASEEGRTIPVRVGETFTVELRAPGKSFGDPVQSGTKSLQLIAASRSDAAAEAYYRALAPGRVLLRATERPICKRGRACPLFIELWRVTVLVRPRR